MFRLCCLNVSRLYLFSFSITIKNINNILFAKRFFWINSENVLWNKTKTLEETNINININPGGVQQVAVTVPSRL